MGKVIAMKITRKGTKEILLERDFTNKDGSLLPSLYFPALERDGIAMNLISTRLGGVSEGQFRSLNLTTGRGDSKENVLENFSRIAAAFGTDPAHCICSHQVHETKVRRVGKEDAGMGLLRPMVWESADGVVTNEPGLVLSTFYADCVPLYVVDPVHRAIGMSHSGWRGTAARMGAVTLSAMQEAYGTRPEDVVCAVGPSICKDCYEVSADVADIFAEEFPGHEQEILAESEKNSVGMAHADKKYQLDLWKANEIIFQEAGVRKEHLAVTDICTCCNPKLLFSHRASHGKRGNLGGFLYLK